MQNFKTNQPRGLSCLTAPQAPMRPRSALALRAALALAAAMAMAGALLLLMALEPSIGAHVLDAPAALPVPAEPVTAAACDRCADRAGPWT